MLARRVTTILATLALALGLAVAVPVATNTTPQAQAASGYCGGDAYIWPYWYDYRYTYTTSYTESWSGARIVTTWKVYRVSDVGRSWGETHKCGTKIYG